MAIPEVSFELIARRFVDAFNRRDADGMVALAHPEIEFHPTSLVGTGQRYDGHEGLRRWVAELSASGMQHQVRVREVRPLDDGFALLSEVLLDGAHVSPSAMVARLNQEHVIIEARAFLSDAELLEHIGLMPEKDLDSA
jgi:hypothetical protein